MITYTKGDIFSGDYEAIVNPVNCVGVMGAGLAKEFRKRYPAMFLAYQSECKKERVSIGVCLVWDTDVPNPKYVVNLPTKIHWKDSSEYEYIRLGLVSLESYIRNNNIKSIGIPALGCGLGGLDWKELRPLFDKYLSDLDCSITVFEPT